LIYLATAGAILDGLIGGLWALRRFLRLAR
jgi:hypothetical protein